MTGSKKDYELVIQKSEKAYQQWVTFTPPQRGELIRLIGNELRDKKKNLGKIVSLETGKTIVEGEGEVVQLSRPNPVDY